MNLANVQTYLRQQQADGWLLYNFRDLNPIAVSVAGLSWPGTRRWFLWIPAEGRPRWLVHAIETQTVEDADSQLQGEVLQYVSWREMADRLPQLLGNESGEPVRALMEYSPGNAIPYISRIDAGIKEVVEGAGVEILSSADVAQLALAVLSPQQIVGHRDAAAVCLAAKDAGFDLITRRLRNGDAVNEYEVQQRIADYFGSNGLERTPCIVAVNANAADPHYFPSEANYSPIQRGDVVLIDLWSRASSGGDACYADITWTAYCGAETPAMVQQVFEVVRTARDRAVAFVRDRLDAGAPIYGYEVDDACRQVIAEAGYGERFIHRTGHSLGPAEHYLGVNIDNLETQDRRELLSGLMFTIEPGIYMPEFDFDSSVSPKGLGIRSEINCVMHSDRVEVTTLPLQTTVRPLLA